MVNDYNTIDIDQEIEIPKSLLSKAGGRDICCND